jgi:hypothetical protein
VYHKRPSELVGGLDDYTAYCFDEAALYLQRRREDGEEPVYVSEASTLAEFYGLSEDDIPWDKSETNRGRLDAY